MKYLILIFTVLLISCSSPSSETASDQMTLEEEVMAIHDSVMPKMGELRSTKNSLLAKADSVLQTDSTHAQVLKELATEIEKANESMMLWMRNYEPEFEGTDAEKEAYLLEQKKAIQQVKDDMEGSLARGEQAL